MKLGPQQFLAKKAAHLVIRLNSLAYEETTKVRISQAKLAPQFSIKLMALDLSKPKTKMLKIITMIKKKISQDTKKFRNSKRAKENLKKRETKNKMRTIQKVQLQIKKILFQLRIMKTALKQILKLSRERNLSR